MQLFGFEIKKKEDDAEKLEVQKSFALPANDDGALTIQVGSYYGTYVDLDGIVRNEVELITKYRQMAGQPELDAAINDIVNESIVTDNKGKCVDINVDDLKQPDNIKKKIRDEFSNILRMLNFGNTAHELFRKWYVDGRLFYQLVINEKSPHSGIQELRYIDPRKIRKIREVQKTKDPVSGVEIVKSVKEYYLYNDRGTLATSTHMGTKIAVDSVVNVNSGIMDERQAMVQSYLHKAIRPLNQLRMVEDATVIYRLARAPERRLFYVDVGNMPPQKADQYLKDVMSKYRNKIVYDANTGEVKDQRKYMAMLEDFWLPRREGNKSTEISTLPGGQNLGEIRDVEYLQKKLYAALDIPFSRAGGQVGPGSSNQQSSVSVGLGRSSEIQRDELKFQKHIDRLRNKFSILFDDILRTQLILKGICTEEDWDEFKEEIFYDYKKDIYQVELKEQELYTQRISLLGMIEPYKGVYFSDMWIKKNVLRLTDDDLEKMQKEMDKEAKDAEKLQAKMAPPMDGMGNPLPVGPDGQPMPQQPPQEIQPLDSGQIDQAQGNKYNSVSAETANISPGENSSGRKNSRFIAKAQ